MALLGFSLAALLLYLTVGCVCWAVGVVVYRLFFHPLAGIPGHPLAAMTWLYQTYNCLGPGGSRYYIEIEKMHKKYGMQVVAIAVPASRG
jgi:hypothetical protein